MQLVNHDVITAFNHFEVCKRVANLYHKPYPATELEAEVQDQLHHECTEAKKYLVYVVDATYKSQRKLQKEIDEINLDQIGLDL